MRIVRLDSRRPDPKALAQAAVVLRSGGLVVYPTETAYALGCDLASAKAVRRVFKVKGRDASKPLPLVAATSAQVRRFARLDGLSAPLAEAFWPGPLSLVLPAEGARHLGAWHLISNRNGEVALRVSSHPIASDLARRLGRPIVATSANRSGNPTPYDVLTVLGDLGTLPDLVLDAGPLKRTPPSTLVRCQVSGVRGHVEILRAGPISERALLRVLKACV